MTTEQIERNLEVAWTGATGWVYPGRGRYLCILAPLASTGRQPNRPHELYEGQPGEVPAYVKVWDALPGIIGDLVERTGLNQATVYSVLGKMRAQGKVQSLKTSTAPVLYSRIVR